MADSKNTGGSASSMWNMRIPPESIRAAAGRVDEIVNEIDKTYMAINDEIGVILQVWQGEAHDRHVNIFNKDAELFNDYMDDMSYEAFRLSIASENYARAEENNKTLSGMLNGSIF